MEEFFISPLEFIISSITVFLLGILELWIAIPAGFALQLNPVVTAVTSSLGAITSVVIILFFGEKIRNKIVEKYYHQNKGRRIRLLQEIWEKYGVIGLGLLSPLLFGAPLGTAIGVALGSSEKKLMIWMMIGIIIWSLGLTFASIQGIKIYQMI